MSTTTGAPTPVTPLPCDLPCGRGQCRRANSTAEPRCHCPPEYAGDYCEHFRCSGHCLNRGLCSLDTAQAVLQMWPHGGKADATTSATPPSDQPPPPLRCHCQPQWTGARCEVPMSFCRERCNGATCTTRPPQTDTDTAADGGGDLHRILSCNCHSGYSGSRCQNCADLECANGGVCKLNATATGGSRCDCAAGYTGRRCEAAICDGYCNGNGQCSIQLVGPVCECAAGFWGRQCESDSCADYCENGGRCVPRTSSAVAGGGGSGGLAGEAGGAKPVMHCECPARYQGDRCQIPVCKDGLCTDGEAGDGGQQPSNGSSTTAAEIVASCETLRCENGGQCRRDAASGRVRCDCGATSGWTGERCEHYWVGGAGTVGACTAELCRNGGVCVRGAETDAGRPRCECAGNWEGEFCGWAPACVGGECGTCAEGWSLNECL